MVTIWFLFSGSQTQIHTLIGCVSMAFQLTLLLQWGAVKLNLHHLIKIHPMKVRSSCPLMQMRKIFRLSGGKGSRHFALQTFDGALENRGAYQLAIRGLLRY